jgi:hypothetical protein
LLLMLLACYCHQSQKQMTCDAVFTALLLTDPEYEAADTTLLVSVVQITS